MNSMYEPACVWGAIAMLGVLAGLVAIGAWGALAFIAVGAGIGAAIDAGGQVDGAANA